MKLRLNSQVLLLLFGLLLMAFTVTSQTTLSGTVVDEENIPLIGANVLIKGTSIGTSTDIDGSFSFTTTESFPLTLEISYTGYGLQEIIVEDAKPINIVMLEGIFTDEVVISASRKREKIQEAPASITVLSARKLEGSPQADPVRNLVNVPGVQIQQQSASRINIEMRGSSGIFGTNAFPIKDYRSLIGPGIGTFMSDQVGLSSIDLERIEVVRGPGSALYGPGVTSGVIHFITKNPIDHPGTTIQLGGGELSTFLSAIRHAGRNEAKTFGYKINASYNRGDEFSLNPNDADDALEIAKFRDRIIQPAVTNGHVDLTKPGEVLLDRADLDPDNDGNVMQNDWWNSTFDGTLEFRPMDDLSVTVAGGLNSASAVFYNDLGEGLSQSREYWTQARVQKGGLFAQFFYVNNNGGTKENPTFLYQSGNRSPVGREQVEAQLQYNFQTPEFLKADWTAGADYRLATNETLNLVYGRNEDDDNYSIFGGYLQGKFALIDKLDLVLAGRYDSFNILDEGFFSPRVAFVFKLDPRHSFRATYNRAGAPPSGLQYNIDFPVNVPIPGLFDFWLAGMKDTHQFSNDAVIDVTLPGVPDLPYGTPGLPLAIPYGAVNAAVLAQLIPGLEADPNTRDLAPAINAFLLGYSPTGFTGSLVGVNAFENNSLLNELISTNKPTVNITNTYEFGYKGLFADKFSLAVDLYRIGRSGFSDFTQIGPLITLQGANIPTDLGNKVAADINPYLVQILTPQVGAENAQAIANQLSPIIGGAYMAGGQGFVAQVPAPLLSSIFGAVESNQVPQNDGIVHVPAGYRIFPDANLNFWGADIAMEYFFSQDLSAWFNYSWVSKTSFKGEELGVAANSPLSYFLNSPKNKFRFGLIYSPLKGFRGNISFQHDDPFFANVGFFAGDVEAKNLVDLGVGYTLTNGLAFDFTATNLLDNEYRAFVNMPKIGRRIIGKVTYTFGKK